MKIEYEYEKDSSPKSECCSPVSYKPKVRVPKDLTEECKEHLEEYFNNKPISEIRAAGEFLSSLYYFVKEKSQESITIEDFEKAKKEQPVSSEDTDYKEKEN